MFLLFRRTALQRVRGYGDLHSNMFLLFQVKHFYTFFNKSPFTFQYVSIISYSGRQKTGFLLFIYIPICFYYFSFKGQSLLRPSSFTFQYVSIISNQGETHITDSGKFTFQYVSIISRRQAKKKYKQLQFTFQYVSIISP